MDVLNKDDQFKKLTPEEKDGIVKDLVSNPEDILCKSMNELFSVRPIFFKGQNRLHVRFNLKELAILKTDELICQFLYKREKLYIFKCHYTVDNGTPCLILDSDFYMIQRRENYRLKFPTGLSSKVIIKNNTGLFSGRVFDLSTTGIRVASHQKTESFKVGDEVDMEIQVAGHDPLIVKSHLRHRNEGSETINDRKLDLFFYGFQFYNLNSDNEKRLSRINMELYRNFFQKMNT
ncbi:MAG: PilZ domain-containing protein [Bdellovibrionaceae bacterium]|nr:PilZ domain-containing protein [Pseudobdellovibrionaceae bacterium]